MPENPWYKRVMKAYVAIADSEGLRSIVPDGDVPDELMIREAIRARGRGWACFWAAIDDEDVLQVREDLGSGRRRDALSLLLALAREVVDYPGGLGPDAANPHSESPSSRAAR